MVELEIYLEQNFSISGWQIFEFQKKVEFYGLLSYRVLLLQVIKGLGTEGEI